MEPVVALHGFAGTSRMWEAVGTGLVAPDLPGHGTASGVRPAGFTACVERVLAAAPDRFVLAGYSMGGRVALHVALAAPERVSRLVLISTTAGIAEPGERARRRAQDEALAERIEREPIEAFADRWTAQPLFAGDPADVRERQREDVLRNEPAGLAASLRGAGAGVMEPLWARLAELDMPAEVVAGERDARYVALGARLVEALDGATELIVVPGAGHGLPREAPEELAALISGGRGRASGSARSDRP